MGSSQPTAAFGRGDPVDAWLIDMPFRSEDLAREVMRILRPDAPHMHDEHVAT